MGIFEQYGLFFLKTITVVIGFLLVIAGIAGSKKQKDKPVITHLNKELCEQEKFLQNQVCRKKPKLKKLSRKEKQALPTVFVLDFNGDMKASQVEELRDCITAILMLAQPKDEVMLRLESPGGAVNGYGLAASQLERLRDAKLKLTVCIDKIAASGGYLMACIADHIIAAPFAIIGSIGVVAQLPNFHRWLKQHHIDFELLTAGEYKRTLTMFGENTAKGREKFQEDLELIHQDFRNQILAYRPKIDIDKVATGEHWLAINAIELKLVDKILTSDAWIMDRLCSHNIYKISIPTKPSFTQKLLKTSTKILHPWS
jgi:serine protease SohB